MYTSYKFCERLLIFTMSFHHICSHPDAELCISGPSCWWVFKSIPTSCLDFSLPQTTVGNHKFVVELNFKGSLFLKEKQWSYPVVNSIKISETRKLPRLRAETAKELAYKFSWIHKISLFSFWKHTQAYCGR